MCIYIDRAMLMYVFHCLFYISLQVCFLYALLEAPKGYVRIRGKKKKKQKDRKVVLSLIHSFAGICDTQIVITYIQIPWQIWKMS